MHIDIRQVSSPSETKTFDTTQLRKNYLIDEIFVSGQVTMTYSHHDRTVVGGAMPAGKPLQLLSCKQIGTENFLDRREMGIVNIGSTGKVTVDGDEFILETTDCLYLPKDVLEVFFESDSPDNPAKFYFVSSPAHHTHKIQKITAQDAIQLELGTQGDANVRTLRQYIHPEVCDSCQLVMGILQQSKTAASGIRCPPISMIAAQKYICISICRKIPACFT